MSRLLIINYMLHLFSFLEVQGMKYIYLYDSLRSCFSKVHERVNTELLCKADTVLPF
jgi:hypothetical protein